MYESTGRVYRKGNMWMHLNPSGKGGESNTKMDKLEVVEVEMKGIDSRPK